MKALKHKNVITSYSIHYTKLYEVAGLGKVNNNNLSVYYEADKTKAEGITYYTVGYGISTSGRTVLKYIANGNDTTANRYYEAPKTADEIKSVLTSLYNGITKMTTGKNAILTEAESNISYGATPVGYEIISGSVNNVDNVGTYNIVGNKLTWNIGDLKIDDTITLKYKIRITSPLSDTSNKLFCKESVLEFNAFDGTTTASGKSTVTSNQPDLTCYTVKHIGYIDRITSYNVCYTKLLRVEQLIK